MFKYYPIISDYWRNRWSFVLARKVCLKPLKSYFKLKILIFLSFMEKGPF